MGHQTPEFSTLRETWEVATHRCIVVLHGSSVLPKVIAWFRILGTLDSQALGARDLFAYADLTDLILALGVQPRGCVS